MAQTPEQRRRNQKFVKEQDLRRGKSEADLKRIHKETQKPSIAPMWIGILAFVIFGGLLADVVSRFF